MKEWFSENRLVIFLAICIIGLLGILTNNEELDYKVKQRVEIANNQISEYRYSTFIDSLNSSLILYILTTEYKNWTVTDYGDFKTIDSLKCIRYREIINFDKHIDSLKKISLTRLELLNKPCFK